jgi:type II secretory pathway pseudopilin PulG
MYMRGLKQTGDTIVEVLIAILVASTVLAGAFVSAQHSLTGTRQSQERSEALKVAEVQLEHLRELIAVPGNNFTDPTKSSTSCISNSAASPPFSWIAVAGIYANDTENFTDTAYHPVDCTFVPAAGVSYYASIQRSGSVGRYTFKIVIHWVEAGGKGNQELMLFYRSYT